MLTLFSFLQKVFHIKKLFPVCTDRKMCCNWAVFVSAVSTAVLISVVNGFAGRGQGVLTAFAKTPAVSLEGAKQEDSEEIKAITNEIQMELSASMRYGQIVVGYLLTQEIQQQAEIKETARSEIEEVKQQILAEAKKAEEAAAKKALGISYSADDYDVLLKIVQAEAGICDEKGKILVANVILNRVRSKEFPDTIKKVVYQPSQFSPVSNGTINSCTVTKETVECVRRALAGEDYSQGALYFMNRSASNHGAARWFDGQLNYLFRHGRHEFFK